MKFETQQRETLNCRRQHGTQAVIDRIGHRTDMQQPGDFRVHLLCGALHAFGGAQHLLRVRQQLSPGLGQNHARGGAFEQANVQFLFQRLDMAADGRLAQVQALGGPCQVAFLRHRGKSP